MYFIVTIFYTLNLLLGLGIVRILQSNIVGSEYKYLVKFKELKCTSKRIYCIAEWCKQST